MNIDLIKAKVLDLAIKGQLVKQRDDEKLSDEILALPNIEGPFEIPKNWKWIKAEYLIDVISGTSYKKEDITNKTEATSIRIIRGGNIQNGKIYFLDDDIFVKNYLKSHESTIQSKDIVIVASTGSKTVIGKAGLIIDNLIGEHSVQIGAFLRIIRPKHNSTSRYLKLFYLTDYYRNIISHSVSGTNINNIKKSHIVDMLIPYPPLQEQIRIVEKVEEIFSILDALKDHQTNLLSKLDLIKKVAIDKAIKGQLVEQKEDEKLSDEILNLPKIEGTFNIPQNWKWVTLDNIGSWKAGSTPSRNNLSYYESGSIPWVKTGDLNDSFIFDTPEKITEKAIQNNKLKINPPGSVLIAMYGATIGKLGILAISATTNQACCACCVNKDMINKYLFYYLSSQKNNLIHLSKGGAQPNISKQIISNYLIPLPTIQEQTRIIQKLEEILSSVNAVENLLKSDKA